MAIRHSRVGMYFVLLKYEINTQGVNFPKNAKSEINDQAVYKAKK